LQRCYQSLSSRSPSFSPFFESSSCRQTLLFFFPLYRLGAGLRFNFSFFPPGTAPFPVPRFFGACWFCSNRGDPTNTPLFSPAPLAAGFFNFLLHFFSRRIAYAARFFRIFFTSPVQCKVYLSKYLSRETWPLTRFSTFPFSLRLFASGVPPHPFVLRNLNSDTLRRVDSSPTWAATTCLFFRCFRNILCQPTPSASCGMGIFLFANFFFFPSQNPHTCWPVHSFFFFTFFAPFHSSE